VAGTGVEQPLHGLGTPACPRLGDGTGCERQAPPTRQGQVEGLDHLGDGPISEQGHSHDEPDDLLCGQATVADGGRSSGREGVADPGGVDPVAELLERLGSGDLGNTLQVVTQAHLHPPWNRR
jgi:hypothetical protein